MRGAAPTVADWLEVADLRMGAQRRGALTFSPREFDVLHVLMLEPARVFSRTELCGFARSDWFAV